MTDLVAVSGACHCVDGWGFLARSMSSLIAGDTHAARHFAYYAELRAALSLLASGGIGVFDRFNVSIGPSGNVVEIDDTSRRRAGQGGKGTHAMAWMALEEWARLATAGDFLSESLSLRGVTFKDAITAIWPGAGVRAPAFDLIMKWGVDLSRASVDRESRNESSYRPQELNQLQGGPDTALDYLTDFWDAFEPDPGDRFGKIDRHLLRLLIEVQYRTVQGGTPNAQRDAFLQARYSNIPTGLSTQIPETFLLRVTEAQDIPLIAYAARHAVPAQPIEMLSRAALLLRLSVALVNKNMFEAGFQPAENGFWCGTFGVARGFWSAGHQPSPIESLWLDVHDSLAEARALRQQHGAAFDNFSWFSDASRGLPRLSEAERIAVWGVHA